MYILSETQLLVKSYDNIKVKSPVDSTILQLVGARGGEPPKKHFIAQMVTAFFWNKVLSTFCNCQFQFYPGRCWVEEQANHVAQGQEGLSDCRTDGHQDRVPLAHRGMQPHDRICRLLRKHSGTVPSVSCIIKCKRDYMLSLFAVTSAGANCPFNPSHMYPFTLRVFCHSNLATYFFCQCFIQLKLRLKNVAAKNLTLKFATKYWSLV